MSLLLIACIVLFVVGVVLLVQGRTVEGIVLAVIALVIYLAVNGRLH